MHDFTISRWVKTINTTGGDYACVEFNSFKAVYATMRLHENFGAYSNWHCNRLCVETRASFLWFTCCSRKSLLTLQPHVTFTTWAQTPRAAFTVWSPACFSNFWPSATLKFPLCHRSLGLVGYATPRRPSNPRRSQSSEALVWGLLFKV